MQVTYKRVPIDSLFEDPANARKHGERNLETISNSLRCFGQVESLVVQKSTGKVIGGNGRLRVMKDLGWDEVDIAEVDITDVQSVSLGIALNRSAELAEWDDEVLAATLNGLALEDGLLEAAGYNEDELAEMLAEIDDSGATKLEDDDNPYTAKIEAPIYEPKGEKPPVTELCDKVKTNELCSEIKAADLPDEVRDFLLTAAQRHTVFNFRSIAEYYCHAPKEVQHLMERSGLVIIDFQKAIQNGFVHLSERLGEIADIELGGVDNNA